MPLSPLCFSSRSDQGGAKGIHDMNISFLCQGWYPSPLRDGGFTEELACAGRSWCVRLAQSRTADHVSDSAPSTDLSDRRKHVLAATVTKEQEW